jgi:hypothetical protein
MDNQNNNSTDKEKMVNSSFLQDFSSQSSKNLPIPQINNPAQNFIPENNYNPPNKSVVAVPMSKKTPIWLYLLYIFTIILFLTVHTLLMKTLYERIVLVNRQKTTDNFENREIYTFPTPTVAIQKDSIQEAIEEAKILEKGNSADDILEDIKNTDFNFLEDVLQKTDNKFNYFSR